MILMVYQFNQVGCNGPSFGHHTWTVRCALQLHVHVSVHQTSIVNSLYVKLT